MSRGGFLNIAKPAGLTSRDVVDRVVRLVRPEKAGHAGTLDPLATGVLVVGVGSAVRLIEYVQQMPKSYTGTFLLGRSSDTEDVEGQVVERIEPPVPTAAAIEEAARTLTGPIMQRPPAYSALKVAGRRAYALARSGQTVELAPRPITIHALRVVRYAYPELVLDIECGSGTYVRSLGRDLAESLGTAAVMSALVRTAIGSFRLPEAIALEELTAETIDERMLPLELAMHRVDRIELSSEEARRVGHGLTIRREAANPGEEFAAFDDAGRLVSILERRADGSLGPRRNFPT